MDRSSASRADSLSRKSAQKRQGLLKHQLQLAKKPNSDRYEIVPIEDTLSFEKGFFLFIRAVQLLTQKIEGVVVVGLAGPSGAGKTVFTEKLSAFMPGIAVISMDNYNDASRVIDGNYDDPRLTDYDTLLENLKDLKEGKAVDVPIYDFKSSSRIGYSKLNVPASRILVVEGIYALSEKLRPLLDLRVSVTGGVHFDLVKRVLRDINRSGQAPEDIIHQISETVYPMYKAFIEPDLETAHLKIVNKFNPFSGFQSATYILKSSRSVSDEQIREVLAPDFTETTESTYDIYLLPPGEDPETCQSYLRMRNRDGKYNLMFEEWVTDNPFIISPRITFEVSVRLLGGLMALGYSMATILKRTSHVFSDDRVTVKIDQLEQLQRKYVQVQGKDRALVAEVGRKLGLEGSYIPRSYIEQIQLEQLTREITTLPEDLKTKLNMPTNIVSSPLPSFSWLSEAKPGVRSLYSKSWSRNQSKDDMNISTEPMQQSESQRIHRNVPKPSVLWADVNGKRFDDRAPDSPASTLGDQGYLRIFEQLASLNERMDELLSRVSELETKFPAPSTAGRPSVHASAGANPPAAAVGSFGSSGGSLYGNGNGNGCGNGHSLTHGVGSGPPSAESTMLDEVRILARSQRHITTQLDVLSNILRENLAPGSQKKHERGRWEGMLGNMKTSNSGLATAAIVVLLGVSGLFTFVVTKAYKRTD